MAGVAQTTVESVNDGKTASWSIHKYIQVKRLNSGMNIRCARNLTTNECFISLVHKNYEKRIRKDKPMSTKYPINNPRTQSVTKKD